MTNFISPHLSDMNKLSSFTSPSTTTSSLLNSTCCDFDSLSKFNSINYLRSRSYLFSQNHSFGIHLPPTLDHIIAHRLPETLHETVLPTIGYDKIFASHWIDDHHVLVGTKCNQLLLINTRTSRILEIPYLSVIISNHVSCNRFVSPLYRDLPSTSSSPSMRLSLTRHDAGIHDMRDLSVNNNVSQSSDSLLACVGIHSIAVNPSRTRLAVGSGKPYEVVIYSLPELMPIYLLTGHTDLVFSVVFVSDDVLVTGSRDTTLGVFSLRSDPSLMLNTEFGPLPVINPLGIRQEHTGKVRDLRYHCNMRQLVSLGLDGTVRVWDVNRMQVSCKTNLHFPNETVCLGIDTSRSMISVGSQANISLLDTRKLGSQGERILSSSRHLHHYKSPDEGWGVRSLAHRHDIITCGGGMGRLGFFDIRILGYIPVGPHLEKTYLEASLNHDITIPSLSPTTTHSVIDTTNRHSTNTVRSAIYTINYSDDGTRLFTGGGPLQLGIRGSYCAVW